MPEGIRGLELYAISTISQEYLGNWEGTPFYSTDFLLDIACSINDEICSIELKFTPYDIDERFTTEQIANFEIELTKMWWDKFYAVPDLHLTHLRLDFTEAYSPDKTFLEDDVAQSLTKFSYGVPGNLEIVAIDATVVVRLHGIIAVKNA